MNIIFLDTEATGLQDARMIQLAYKMRGSDELFTQYYKPPVPIEFEAMGIHHITQKMVDDKIPFDQSPDKPALQELLNTSILVAHNAAFDIEVLKTEGIATKDYICTYKVAYALYDLPNHKMQSLRYRWSIEIDQAVAHDAAGDVMVLEEVFEYMLKDYCATNGVSPEEAIQKFIEISTQPTLLKTLSFGKLRGETFEDIRIKDFGYLQWLGTLTDKDDDFVYTIQHYLKKGPSGN